MLPTTDDRVHDRTDGDLITGGGIRGSRDWLRDWNLITDEVYSAPQFNQMLRLEERSLWPRPEVWIVLIVSVDLCLFQSKLESYINGSKDIFECEIRTTHTEGELRWMRYRSADGRAIRLVGSIARSLRVWWRIVSWLRWSTPSSPCNICRRLMQKSSFWRSSEIGPRWPDRFDRRR